MVVLARWRLHFPFSGANDIRPRVRFVVLWQTATDEYGMSEVESPRDD
jgi:hypothetical protein